jgi:hypothetical protein
MQRIRGLAAGRAPIQANGQCLQFWKRKAWGATCGGGGGGSGAGLCAGTLTSAQRIDDLHLMLQPGVGRCCRPGAAPRAPPAEATPGWQRS